MMKNEGNRVHVGGGSLNETNREKLWRMVIMLVFVDVKMENEWSVGSVRTGRGGKKRTDIFLRCSGN